jgi:hypothetical protein
MPYLLDDTVRIVRLLVPDREVTRSSPSAPPPRVGDWGIVVADVGDDLYLVEARTDDGVSLWLAEFADAELILVDRADEAR